MFTVTLKIMTHMGILSDRQITLYRIHAQKRLCKRNFYFSGKHVEIKNSPYEWMTIVYFPKNTITQYKSQYNLPRMCKIIY